VESSYSGASSSFIEQGGYLAPALSFLRGTLLRNMSYADYDDRRWIFCDVKCSSGCLWVGFSKFRTVDCFCCFFVEYSSRIFLKTPFMLCPRSVCWAIWRQTDTRANYTTWKFKLFTSRMLYNFATSCCIVFVLLLLLQQLILWAMMWENLAVYWNFKYFIC